MFDLVIQNCRIVNENKIAGIMTEIIDHNNMKYVIIGTGINIAKSPKLSDYKTCCLNDYNSKIKYEEILISFLKNFFSEYEIISKKETLRIDPNINKNKLP